MSSSTVMIRMPAALYAELQLLADEEESEPVELIAEFVSAARSQRAWRSDLAALRAQITQDGGLNVGVTKDEVVARLRATRQVIFEAEYAHLYR